MTDQVSLVKMKKLVRCKFFFSAVFTFTTAVPIIFRDFLVI